jgi:hypothetical protein
MHQPGASAGPSNAKGQNPFFKEQPQPPKGVSRDDFNPWKHGQVPAASSIRKSLTPLPLYELTLDPQWPYTGRRYNSAFLSGPHMHPGQMGGGGFDDDPTSPHAGPPHMMPGMPPNFPPYAYRFQVSNVPRV